LDKNPVHSVLYLVITFFAIAAHYLILKCTISGSRTYYRLCRCHHGVVFLYVIMMLNLNKGTLKPHKKEYSEKIAAVISAGVF
jgi:NADH-quinone oxidoreductase subunit J